jgi:demethylmenaquinone methyltransferase/2-methoxy-6-polyprenyl-1,4-benzoquinol methylase
MFSKIARRYDLLNHLLSLNMDRGWRRRLAETARVPSGGRVLDACAGTGDVAVAFAGHSAAAEVVAVDLSREMLKIGRAKAKRADLRGAARFVEGDVLSLPFGNGSFDVVTIAFGLRNLASYEKGLSEMSRVLVPGGRIAILEFAPSPRGLFGSGYAFYLRKAIPRIGGIISGSKAAYDYLARSVGEFLSAERVLDLMAGAGLRNLSAEPLTGGIVYIYCGEK